MKFLDVFSRKKLGYYSLLNLGRIFLYLIGQCLLRYVHMYVHLHDLDYIFSIYVSLRKTCSVMYYGKIYNVPRVICMMDFITKVSSVWVYYNYNYVCIWLITSTGFKNLSICPWGLLNIFQKLFREISNV